MEGGHECSNGPLDDSMYSSPVPLIGMYIAGGSSVCLLLVFFDIVAGLCSKKTWFPCRFFSLNSVTLTLLSIAAKIPVDLTTPMPRGQDQLSKLTGTTFICIFMGFIMPSLGKVGKPESVSNMIALTILVFTIVANICMQMFTGVIFSFTVEHIMIICSMLILLLLLWVSVTRIDTWEGSLVDRNKELLMEGKDSFLERLERCYIHGYKKNPQVFLSLVYDSSTVGMICIFSLLVLIQASFRTLVIPNDLKFCNEVDSDYGWSMWIIVLTQILFVVVGGFATRFRFREFSFKLTDHPDEITPFESIVGNNPILGRSSRDICVLLLNVLVMSVYVLIILLMILPNLVFRVICVLRKDKNGRTVGQFKDLIDHKSKEVEEWVIEKGIKDMEIVMEEVRRVSPANLIQLFSKTPPSEVSLTNQLSLSNDHRLLPMILLVRIAMISALSSDLSEILFRSLSETYEIIGFIDRRLSSSSSMSRTKSMIVKAAWQCMKNEDFSSTNELMSQPPSLGAIKELRDKMPEDIVRMELDVLVNFIENRACELNEEVFNIIKQLFVDMLHDILKELPNIVFIYVTESPVREYEYRVKRVMKFVCKMELLATQVSWVFPKDSGIIRLVTVEVDNGRISEDGVSAAVEGTIVQVD